MDGTPENFVKSNTEGARETKRFLISQVKEWSFLIIIMLKGKRRV